MKDIKLSALNLVREGQNDQDAINDMVNLAQGLDDLGMNAIGLLNIIMRQT